MVSKANEHSNIKDLPMRGGGGNRNFTYSKSSQICMFVDIDAKPFYMHIKTRPKKRKETQEK